MKYSHILCTLLFFIFGAVSTAAQNERFLGDPAITPDGKTIVFTYESDLWKSDINGDNAVRLTAMDGNEGTPSISPDGKWLAFSSNQFGNNDVYIMPMQGGEIQQLTYHQANDIVESWDWDSKHIYIASNRYNRVTGFKVSIDGGTPKRIFSHYHNMAHNIAVHPKTGEIFFNETWESWNFKHRKRYVGSFNPDIKSYNLETQTLTQYTDYEGKDFGVILSQSGDTYFVSDEGNKEYNLFQLVDGQKKRLTNFNTSIYNPSISADGSTIVFEKDYQLFKYDVRSGKTTPIRPKVFKNYTLAKTQDFDVKDNISAFDVSPDSKKLAFVSRGELFISDIKGKFVRQLSTAPSGRVLEVKWLADSKTVLFNQTVNGYQNWFTIAADGSSEAKQHSNDSQNNRLINLNHDRTKGVYLSERNELRVMDLKSFKSELIVEDEFWGFQNDAPSFSPDGNYVLYSARRNFETDVFVHHLDSKKTLNLTNTGVSESGPYWGPEGKYIYFATNRVAPSYPRGSGDADLYRMALDLFQDPFKSTLFDELFNESEDEKEQKDDDSNIEITINEEGLLDRLERVGAIFGNQFSPFVIKDGNKTHIFYGSNHDEGSSSLWITTLEPFNNPKTQKIDPPVFGGGLVAIDGKVFGLSRGNIISINPSSAKADKIDLEFEFTRSLADEFNQMFDELWANIEENFYDNEFHGIDWKAIRKRYKSYLPFVQSRADLRRLNNDMLGELNSSHMGFSTFGEEENTYHSTFTLATGIIWDQDNPYKVAGTVKGSPAYISKTPIVQGDILTAVNGTPVRTDINRASYFSSPNRADELLLSFKSGNKEKTVKIHPTSYNSIKTGLYDEWVDANQHRVDTQSDKRIAYVHMKNMGGGSLDDFLIEMTSEAYSRDGLILDLRYNTGGNVHDAVLQFLSQRPYLNWAYRDGELAPQPNFSPASKPIVLLINEQSLSDAEVTTAGFKELGLGTVIGNETYRWIIFTSGKGLVDGSFYRLPSWGVYSLTGENLEMTGVKPDIEADNTFKDRLLGQDPQLDLAIDHVLKELNKN